MTEASRNLVAEPVHPLDVRSNNCAYQKPERPESEQCISEQLPSHPNQWREDSLSSEDILNQRHQSIAKLHILILQVKLEEMGFKKTEYDNPLRELTHTHLTHEMFAQNIQRVTDKIYRQRAFEQEVQLEHENYMLHRTGRNRLLRSILRHPLNPGTDPVLHARRSLRLQLPPILAPRELSGLVQQKPGDSEIMPKLQPQACSQFVCMICLETVNKCCLCNEIGCGHRFCDGCIIGYVQGEIDAASYDIVCPEENCRQSISEQTIQKCHSSSKHKRYLRLKQRSILEKDPNNKFCSELDCQGLLKTKSDIAGLICEACGAVFCDKCLRPRHEKECELNIESTMNKIYNHLNIHKCPKCSVPIQKSEGCNHMNCPKCNYQFCWICMGEYTSFHYRAYNIFGCPGLQFEDENNKCRIKTKRVLMCLGLPLFFVFGILLIVLGLPSCMLYQMARKPCEWACERRKSGCCGFMQFVMIWLALQPVGILYGVLVAPILYMKNVCIQVHDIFT